MKCLLYIPALILAPAMAAAADQTEPGFGPGIVLPEGRGKAQLLKACTNCHDLKGLPAYSDYWGLERWRAMVETMVKNGAELDAEGMELVTGYLAEFFGPEDRQ